ncbi:MAG: CPBP family glutamic-type intramembrane protease [Bacillota bacterium]
MARLNNYYQLPLKLLFISLFLLCFYQELLYSFKRLKIMDLIKYALLPAVFILLTNWLISLLPLLAKSSGAEVTYSIDYLLIISIVIVAPIYEEFYYRFIFMNNAWALETKIPLVIISALAFACAHGLPLEVDILSVVQLSILGLGSMLIYTIFSIEYACTLFTIVHFF